MIEELSHAEPLRTKLNSTSSDINFINRCTVLCLSKDINTIHIYEQFKKARGFQLGGLFSKEEIVAALTEQKESNVSLVASNYFTIDSLSLVSLNNEFNNSSFLLVDSLGMVRRKYDNNEEEKRKLINHIPVLLPYFEEDKRR